MLIALAQLKKQRPVDQQDFVAMPAGEHIGKHIVTKVRKVSRLLTLWNVLFAKGPLSPMEIRPGSIVAMPIMFWTATVILNEGSNSNASSRIKNAESR